MYPSTLLFVTFKVRYQFDMAAGERGVRDMRKTDTMPQPGKVGQVCQKWLVHEDEALAIRLQNEESEWPLQRSHLANFSFTYLLRCIFCLQ